MGVGTGVHDDRLTGVVIGAAIEVHRELGPGVLESAYEVCLADELVFCGVRVQRQVELPVRYRGRVLDCGYRIDMIVEDAVVVELKCVEKIAPIHHAQLLSYLKLSGKRVGLLINFHVPILRDGIVRRVP